MGDRNSGRELAFKALFQWSFKMATVEKVLEGLVGTLGREDAKNFATKLMSGCAEHLEEVDAAIKEQSKNWDLARIGACDRAALRLGTYELLFSEDVPAEVAINEAVELAKNYGDDSSPKFVNGILDEIRKARDEVK